MSDEVDEHYLKALAKLKCEQEHLFFTRYFFKARQGIKFLVNWHHMLISDAIEDVINGKTKNLIINVSPGASKTEIVVINLIARGLALNPRARFLHLSGSSELASLNSSTARDIVMSDPYQALWPLKIAEDAKAKKRWNVLVDGQPAGGVYATSLGGQVTGFRAGHMAEGFQGAIVCFPHEQSVLTEGGFIPIGKIVDEKMKVRVYSRNFKTGKVELKHIARWNKNPGSSIVEVSFKNGTSIKCTPDHLIWTENRKWVKAIDLLATDIPFPAPHEILPNGLIRKTKSFADRYNALAASIKFLPIIRIKGASPKVTLPNNFSVRGYVRPTLSVFNITYNRFTDAIVFSNLTKKSRVFANFPNILIRKLRPIAVLPSVVFSHSHAILNVIGSRAIAEIRQAVITLDSILMPYFNSRALFANKGLHNGLMNLNPFFDRRRGCTKVEISPGIFTKNKNASFSDSLSKPTLIENESIKASCSTHIGDLVAPLKPLKCQPDFVRFIRHDSSTYCLTVEDNHNFFVGENQQALLVSNCDDPIKPEDAYSKTKLDAANRKLLTTVKSRKANPDTPIIIVMQRLAENDPVGFIKSGNVPGDWKYLIIPAVIDEEYVKTLPEKYKALIDRTVSKDGRFSYWPYKEPLDDLLTMERGEGQNQNGGRVSRQVFASQYQQHPIALGGNLIKGSDFRTYQVLPNLKSRAIYADTAQKTAERNDYSVFEEWGLGDDGRIYLLDMIRGKWEAPELQRRAIGFWSKCKARDIEKYGRLRKIIVEDKSSGTGLIQTIKLPPHNIPVEGIERNKDKFSRVNDILAYIESGQVCLPIDAPFTNDFIAECEAFSADDTHEFDDQIDPMVDAINDMLSSGNKLKVWQRLGASTSLS